MEIPASQNNHTDPDTDPALECVPALARALVGIGPLLYSMFWPLEVCPVVFWKVMPVHWSTSAVDKMQMRDLGQVGSVERPDTEVPWGPQPLPAMGAIMTRLLCVTVVAILAAGVLMETIFHSSFFFIYCCLWKERGSLYLVSMLQMER